ncbi:response regulator [Anatilimnocola sp. NA78]|uniref:response regulator n=1 Tax=Anatilimnocola sp. NA78 TaxID=3415683 RepID=UPI003CE4A384
MYRNYSPSSVRFPTEANRKNSHIAIRPLLLVLLCDVLAIVKQMTNSQAKPSNGRPLSILVVDDNVDAANSMAMLLTRLGGHEARVAYSGQTAIEIAQLHQPEVILLDIGLPKLDGYEVARMVRAMPETCSAVIIAVTGYARATDRELSLAAGIDLHLLKPVNTPELLGYLRDKVGKKAAR